MTEPTYTPDDIHAAAAAALASGLMTGNDEHQPSSYAVNAEWVEELVRVIVDAVAASGRARV